MFRLNKQTNQSLSSLSFLRYCLEAGLHLPVFFLSYPSTTFPLYLSLFWDFFPNVLVNCGQHFWGGPSIGPQWSFSFKGSSARDPKLSDKNVRGRSKAQSVRQTDSDFGAFLGNLICPQVPLILPSQLCESARILAAFFEPNWASSTLSIGVRALISVAAKHPFPESVFLLPTEISIIYRKSSTFSSFLFPCTPHSTVPTGVSPCWCIWTIVCSASSKSSGPRPSELSCSRSTIYPQTFSFVPRLSTSWNSLCLFQYSYPVFGFWNIAANKGS